MMTDEPFWLNVYFRMKDLITVEPGEEKVVLIVTLQADTVTSPPINYYFK